MTIIPERKGGSELSYIGDISFDKGVMPGDGAVYDFAVMIYLPDLFPQVSLFS